MKGSQTIHAYSVHGSHLSSAILLEQSIKDYDPAKGYAAKPGYIERAQKVLRGELEPNVESPFTVIRGHQKKDLVEGTIDGQYFVSSRFEEVLIEEGVQGFRLRNELVLTPSGEELSYKRLIIIGRCGRTKRLNADKPLDLPLYSCDSPPPPQIDLFVAEHGVLPFCNERLGTIIKMRKLTISLRPVRLVVR